MSNDSSSGGRVGPFDFSVELSYPIDFTLLQNGPVSGYRTDAVLDRDLSSLAKLGYGIEDFSCAAWQDDPDMHHAFAKRFQFPDYYGHNYDALDEVMADTNVIDVPERGGLVVVLRHIDRWRGQGDVLVSVLAGAARYWSLFGRRMIVLVHAEDQSWNGPENLAATRIDWRP